MLSVNSSDKHQLRSVRTETFMEGFVDFSGISIEEEKKI